MGNPHHIQTSVQIASMRQIHAAIDHLRRGDFECAVTLAAAGERMLPAIEEPRFRELKSVARVDVVASWLRSGEIRDEVNGTGQHRDAIEIEELDVVIAICRAITRFEAIFRNDKTPQMLSFQNCSWRRLEGVMSGP